jgi:Fe-S cluster assembly ATPase SufC
MAILEPELAILDETDSVIERLKKLLSQICNGRIPRKHSQTY